MELNRGNNVLYWRTTAFSVWSKVSKPVLVRNIAITGMEGRVGSGQGSGVDVLTLYLCKGDEISLQGFQFPCSILVFVCLFLSF